jgi:hypothetical protein
VRSGKQDFTAEVRGDAEKTRKSLRKKERKKEIEKL